MPHSSTIPSITFVYRPGDWGEGQAHAYDLATDPTTCPQLPTEVWECILDELDFESTIRFFHREVFFSCCMVCQSWLPRSRYHLFKYLQVRSKEQVKQVSKLLNSIPALRTRAEELTVYGSDNAKKDASWIGLVGLHLGSKLKSLGIITIRGVDFTLAKLEFYKFWGAFNGAWQPDTSRRLETQDCTVTHLNQLVRLASVTKAWELSSENLESSGGRPQPKPPIPVLPSGISLPLRKFAVSLISLESIDLVLSMEWHTLAQRCPSLFRVELREPPFSDGHVELDFLFPKTRLCLVSIFDMFRRMQRHNITNEITFVFSGIHLALWTRPSDQPDDTNIAPRDARPHLHRVLVLSWNFQDVEYRDNKYLTDEDGAEVYAQALVYFEDSMSPGANNVNRGFHHIKIVVPPNPRPHFLESLDTVLSRLRVTAPDAHIDISCVPELDIGCGLVWAREHLPTFAQVAPKVFCDPETGQLCQSHLSQVPIGNDVVMPTP